MTPHAAPAIRLLLIDPHDMVRAGLRQLLDTRHILIAGECRTLSEGAAAAVRLQPDVVLMEPNTPHGCGLQTCREIRAACLGTRVIFLTAVDGDEEKLNAILAGADGYLLKDIDAATLTASIKAVAAGQSILDQDIVRLLLKRIQSRPPHAPGGKALSPQERKILSLVAEGKTNKEIGDLLGLSHKTVKNYLSNVFQKLQVSRRSQAAALFARTHTG